jgi:hypothetical protein
MDLTKPNDFAGQSTGDTADNEHQPRPDGAPLWGPVDGH